MKHTPRYLLYENKSHQNLPIISYYIINSLIRKERITQKTGDLLSIFIEYWQNPIYWRLRNQFIGD